MNRALCLMVCTWTMTPATAAEPPVESREQLIQAIRDARPGDVIRIAAGTLLQGGIEIRELHGTESAPIRIISDDPKQPAVIQGGSGGLHLTACSHIVIDGLHIRGASGNGINVDEGGPQNAASAGIVLRNLLVTDIGPDGNRDGIKLSGLAHFRVEHCLVERWGTGGSGIDLVGCQDGVISDCHFSRDPNDAKGLQQSNGVQIKGGSSEVVVRHCTFRSAGSRGVNLGGSTGREFFRPGDATWEARRITVEDCRFAGGMSAVAFVSSEETIVRHNLIWHPQRWAVRILQENRMPGFVTCRNGRFTDNIIVFDSRQMVTAVNVGDETAPESFHFSGNVWYCDDRPDETRRRVRLPVAESDGLYDTDPRLANPPDRLELHPDSPVRNKGVRPDKDQH